MERAEQASEEGTSDFWGYSSTGYAPRAESTHLCPELTKSQPNPVGKLCGQWLVSF